MEKTFLLCRLFSHRLPCHQVAILILMDKTFLHRKKSKHFCRQTSRNPYFNGKDIPTNKRGILKKQRKARRNPSFNGKDIPTNGLFKVYYKDKFVAILLLMEKTFLHSKKLQSFNIYQVAILLLMDKTFLLHAKMQELQKQVTVAILLLMEKTFLQVNVDLLFFSFCVAILLLMEKTFLH